MKQLGLDANFICLVRKNSRKNFKSLVSQNIISSHYIPPKTTLYNSASM